MVIQKLIRLLLYVFKQHHMLNISCCILLIRLFLINKKLTKLVTPL